MIDAASLLDRPMTPPRPGVLEAVARGPISAADALSTTQLHRLLDPSPLRAETSPTGVRRTTRSRTSAWARIVCGSPSRAIPASAARSIATHCAREYAHLATLLLELSASR